MALDGQNILECIEKYLKVFGENLMRPLLQHKDIVLRDKKCGFAWITTVLLRVKRSELLGKNEEEKALVQQWLEYIIMNFICSHNATDRQHALWELNEILSDHVYLVAAHISVVDIVMYYTLYPILDKLPDSERRQYVDICRWFDNIQQDSQLRQDNPLLTFDLLPLE